MDERLANLFTPWKIGNVELKNRIVLTSMGGTDLFGWMEKNHFDEEGANVETSLKEVRDGEILCPKADKEIKIKCDSVISSAGYIPAPLQSDRKDVLYVGDCRQIGNLRSVIWGAYEAAMKI